MRSQKGIGLVQLVIIVIALMLISGTATYVALTSDAFVQEPKTVNAQMINKNLFINYLFKCLLLKIVYSRTLAQI